VPLTRSEIRYRLIAKFVERVPKLGNLLTRQDDATAKALALKKGVTNYNIINSLLQVFN
jgi:hypothetical protein